jgi:hypothetical protein
LKQLIGLFILGMVNAAPEADKMTMLPIPNSDKNLTLTTASYSGYLNVSQTKALHYVFVES